MTGDDIEKANTVLDELTVVEGVHVDGLPTGETVRRGDVDGDLLVLDATADLPTAKKARLSLLIMGLVIVSAAAGVLPVEMSGFIELGLQAIYRGDDPKVFRRRKGGCAKGLGCGGDGGGCG